MNDDYNVKLLNNFSKKSIKIDYLNKMINASDVYDVLSYTIDSNYIIESNLDSINEGNEKDYLNEIIQLIESITNELNNLNNTDAQTEGNNASDKNNVNSDEIAIQDDKSIIFEDFF